MNGFAAVDAVWDTVPDADLVWSPSELGEVACRLLEDRITLDDVADMAEAIALAEGITIRVRR